MVIRLKDTAKLFGITIIACCAVFVCTLFLSYNIDLAAIKDEIVTEAGTEMYNAQVLMGRVIAAVSGGCLIATSVVMLLFYVKNYISTHERSLAFSKHSATPISKLQGIFGYSGFRYLSDAPWDLLWAIFTFRHFIKNKLQIYKL